MDELLDDAAARAKRYWRSLDERRVSPAQDALARLTELEEPFPADQSDPRAVLALLDEIGSPTTVATAGPRFFGFVIGGALPTTVAASWLASAWDQNAGLIAGSPIDAKLEDIALGWIVDALGLPTGTGAGFVTGATTANFTALLAARHAVLENAGWNVESDGLFGAPPVTVVVGDEAHPTLMRSISMAGFGHQRVTRLPVDGQGRIRVENLPRLEGPAIVCIQAGNVNTGAFDPAEEICRWAHEHGAWVHADSAFGIWAAAAPARAHLFHGFEQGDSWATDAHKWA
jgi:glutamate/tyrosine decarboxylase-like PLP-dependent enzyme